MRAKRSDVAVRLLAEIESHTGAKVSLRPPAITNGRDWKAIAHGGTCGLRGCSGPTEVVALERLWRSVEAEPGVPAR